MNKISLTLFIISIGFLMSHCSFVLAEESSQPDRSGEPQTTETKSADQKTPAKADFSVGEEKSKTAEPERKVQESEEKKKENPQSNEDTKMDIQESVSEGKKSKPSINQSQLESAKSSVQSEAEIVGCVTPLKDLVTFYEKESLSIKKMIERWNVRTRFLIDRKSNLDSEIDTLNQELFSQQKAGDKKSKQEVARSKKQMKRLLEDKKILEKNIQAQCKDLALELKELSKETQLAVKEKFQQIQQSVETPEKE